MTAAELIAFEDRVRAAFEAGECAGPVHLSGGNEDQLIEIFKEVKEGDHVFSTWRNHYHALLHGLPPEWVYSEIIAGRSLSLNSAMHRFYTSAIVGGILPIAVGVAAAIKRRARDERVWCFVGDMCASTGAFADVVQFSDANELPIVFVVEDNGMSTETPTREVWGGYTANYGSVSNGTFRHYRYERTVPHYGAGKQENL
jgi:TPP-dependent pyruvate/acetoin dehydrogenase alpha subunit